VVRGKLGFLGDIANPGKPSHSPRPTVRFFKAGEDFQERGFARAIGTDKADTISLAEAERESGKKRLRIVGFANCLAAEEDRPTHNATEPVSCSVEEYRFCPSLTSPLKRQSYEHGEALIGFSLTP
jgi:hypothetical protein